MGFQEWRRYHGELTAHVIAGLSGSYTVAVSNERGSRIRQLPRAFRRLEAAKAAADDLLRTTFSHKCSVESCGEWMAWS